MKSLAGMFAEAGCEDVLTYIQSGNVVFRAKEAAARRLAGVIGRGIEERLGLHVPVVTRSAAELAAVARRSGVGRRVCGAAAADDEQKGTQAADRRPAGHVQESCTEMRAGHCRAVCTAVVPVGSEAPTGCGGVAV